MKSWRLKTVSTLLAELGELAHKYDYAGLTHLQVAQPVTFGHHITVWFEMLLRDRDRLIDCRKEPTLCLWGRPHLLELHSNQKKNSGQVSGFDQLTRNSLDGVSDRDFLIEFLRTHDGSFLEMVRRNRTLVIPTI